MSTALQISTPGNLEVSALSKTCQELARESALDRFEIAVKGRLQAGIRNDNDLRIADDLLHQVVLGADALEAGTKPAISAAYNLHKSLLAAVKPWKERWGTMRDSLSAIIVNYSRAKEDMARRQQRELERAAEEERARREAEARLALRNGDMAAAEAVMQQAQMMPVIMAAAPVLDHSQGRKPWQVEVTDDMAVIQGIAAGVIPLSALRKDAWDLSFLKKEATKRGGLPAAWAGLRAWQEDRLAVRR